MQATLIDYMGSDLTVVNSARVSFNKESEWEWDIDYDQVPVGKEVQKLSDQDKKLISYLASHNHWTPFSHVQITMREKVPIFVARQRFKHMVGFTYNEVSRRYVDDEPEFFVPDTWRKKAENKKQGSSDEEITHLPYDDHNIGDPVLIDKTYDRFIYMCKQFYQQMLAGDVAPEMARMVLPQSMYTEYYVTGSLVAWARAYKLRSDEHSQKEIQELATQWTKLIGGISELENSWKALTK